MDWDLNNTSAADLAKELAAFPVGDEAVYNALQPLLDNPDTTLRDLEKYKAAYKTLLVEESETLWHKLVARLNIVNCDRRGAQVKAMKIDDLQPYEVELAAIMNDAMMELPQGTERYRLMGMAGYNLGLVLRGKRDYWMAVMAHAQSSFNFSAADDHDSVCIALFLESVETVSALLSSDNPEPKTVQRALNHMVLMREQCRETTTEYPRWMKNNAALHIWWAHLVAVLRLRARFIDEASLYTGDLVIADRKEIAQLNPRKNHWGALFWIAGQSEGGDWQGAVEGAQAATSAFANLPSSSIANTYLTWKLIEGRVRRNMRNQTPEAKACFEEVAAYTGPDGGVPIAIAKAILEDRP